VLYSTNEHWMFFLPGYLASWRPVCEGRGAIRITGSPFKTFDEAEAACDAMLKHLTSD
jgi:hypothetical protein